MRPRGVVITSAALVGATLGWVAVQAQLRRHREDLFHRRPLRRLAALGYLEGEASVDALRLVEDYLAWEKHPLLRRKARAVRRRLQDRMR